jgi:GrpB-like predicted nucleotidyltransferase (UPF0157 family)
MAGGAPSLGLARDRTVVRRYDLRWAQEFASEQERLRLLLAGLAADVEHVGSTAVPGLPAKPVLDIAVAVAGPDEVDQAAARLESAGYECRGDAGAEGGVIFVRGPETWRTHCLHLVGRQDPQWGRYIVFRDALRTDAELRSAYAALKQALAARFPLDRPAYVRGKAPLIEATLDRLGAPAPRAVGYRSVQRVFENG